MYHILEQSKKEPKWKAIWFPQIVRSHAHTHTATRMVRRTPRAERVCIGVRTSPQTIEQPKFCLFVSVGTKLSTESNESEREREFVSACACEHCGRKTNTDEKQTSTKSI